MTTHSVPVHEVACAIVVLISSYATAAADLGHFVTARWHCLLGQGSRVAICAELHGRRIRTTKPSRG